MVNKGKIVASWYHKDPVQWEAKPCLQNKLWPKRHCDGVHYLESHCFASYFIGLFGIKTVGIKTVDLAHPRKCSMVTRPFSL